MAKRRSVARVRAGLICAGLASVAIAQGVAFVHPAGQPPATSFDQPPPAAAGFAWKGPRIGGVYTHCWHAEPNAPTVPIGGENDWQKVSGFVRIDLDPGTEIETSFKQNTFGHLAGGGAKTELTPADLPAGIFVSVKAHPVFKVTRVHYPVTEAYPPLVGPKVRGLRLDADFMHLPSMGECYFYFAVWEAEKVK